MTLTTAVSWLFVPATRPERFAKATAGGADVVIESARGLVNLAEIAAAESVVRHPVQVPLVHAAFVPSSAEVDRALAADLGGAASLDGEMIDRPGGRTRVREGGSVDIAQLRDLIAVVEPGSLSHDQPADDAGHRPVLCGLT